jgi:hypothetical protein
MIRTLPIIIFFALNIFANSARADTIDTMATILDKAPAGSLPFSGNDVRKYKSLIQNCESAGNFDQIILCVDKASKDPQIGDAAEIPSWFPLMLDVYFDIKKKDYWGLLADAGEAIACVAAQVLADGFDVCGVIKDIIETAQAVASAAQAVGKFFADLGSSLAGLGGDIACAISSLWGGCDDSPPPPPANAVAYQGYYFPRVQNGEGLAKRMSDPNTWHAYAGQSPNDSSAPIIAAGVQAKMPKDGMIKALPAFWAAVYKQWDSKIGGEFIPKGHQAADQFKLPSKVNEYVAQGQAAWDGVLAYQGSFGNPVGVSMEPLLQPGMNACRKALENAGAKQVDDWVKEGQLQKSGLGGLSWPSGNYMELCDGFRNQLRSALTSWAGQKAITESGCAAQNDGTYFCGNTNVTLPCKNGMVTLGQSPNLCINKGPAPGEMPKQPYVCPGGICKMYTMGKAPAGCKVLELKDAQKLCKNSTGDDDHPGFAADMQSNVKPMTPAIPKLPSNTQDMSTGQSSNSGGINIPRSANSKSIPPASSAPVVVPPVPVRGQ